MSSSGKEARPFDKFVLERALNLHVGKRDLLIYGGVGIFGTALLATTAFGSTISRFLDRSNADENDSAFKPGWIEKDIKADLIDSDPERKGHLNFLREAVFSNPILFDSTVEYYKFLNDKAEKNERQKLGDMLAKAYDLVSGKLEGANQVEKMHAAVYVFTAGLNPWFSEEEMAKLGVDVSGRGVGGYFWDKDGIGTKVFPKVLGNGRDDLDEKLIEKGHAPRYGGQDRAVHFAHHLLLTYLYVYSKHFGLQIHEKIPEVLKHTLKIWGIGSKEREAEAFSYVVGQLFEFSALRNFDYWRIPFIKEDVNEGRLEDMAPNDIKANKRGSKAGIYGFEEMLQGKSPDDFFKALNEVGE